MVRLKFVIANGSLVLRFSEGKERFYKRVGFLLKGEPNIEKHWLPSKEQFSRHAVMYEENNKILSEYKEIFSKLIREQPGLSARQATNYYQNNPNFSKAIDWRAMAQRDDAYKNCIAKFIEVVIERERAKAGCNFEGYYKLLQRCRRDIPNFDLMPFSALDFNRMVDLAYIFAKHKGYRHMTRTFRAVLGRAHKDRDVNFNLSQIGAFCFNDYNPDKYAVEKKQPDVLTEEQLRQFMSLDVDSLTPQYRDRYRVRLYYDFCVFMFHSFLAPCDVIKAKRRDITKRNTLQIRRKKTHRAVEIPITPVMREIVDKYENRAKDGYLFPIMEDGLDEVHNTKDYAFKKFRQELNVWLKFIGVALNTDFKLYSYVFRHTAITVACDAGLPIAYVASAAGTSIEMIQKHYYNGECLKNREALTSVFMNVSNAV